jgi:hypothetical protein
MLPEAALPFAFCTSPPLVASAMIALSPKERGIVQTAHQNAERAMAATQSAISDPLRSP